MFVGDTNGTEITELLSKLHDKSSSAVDEVSKKLLKSCSLILLPYLVHLINLSLRQRISPQPLKVMKTVVLCCKRSTLLLVQKLPIWKISKSVCERYSFTIFACRLWRSTRFDSGSSSVSFILWWHAFGCGEVWKNQFSLTIPMLHAKIFQLTSCNVTSRPSKTG